MTTLRRVLLSRAWLFAISYGLFAYVFHQIGAESLWYPRFFWYQLVAHFLSASGVALLLARFGISAGLDGRRLLVFVVAFSLAGAIGWEVTEYLGIWRGLHWWGIDDSLLDLSMDLLGIGTVLFVFRTRFRAVLDPSMETPSPGWLPGVR